MQNSSKTNRELAIDSIFDGMTDEEADSALLIRDANLDGRAVIITDTKLYVIRAIPGRNGAVADVSECTTGSPVRVTMTFGAQTV